MKSQRIRHDLVTKQKQQTRRIKIPDAGKDRRHEEKRKTEDEIVGKHHQINGYEFEQVS